MIHLIHNDNHLLYQKIYINRIQCAWYRSYWYMLCIFTSTMVAILSGIIVGAPASYIIAQLLLGLSVHVSFGLLSNRPLFNPVQATVVVFYWWFGVAPTISGLFKHSIGRAEEALSAQACGVEAIFIVVLGLPLYAIASDFALSRLRKVGWSARFLLPSGKVYKVRTVLCFAGLSLISTLLLSMLNFLGIRGMETTSYLGGIRTTIWWVGIIANVAAISSFANSALMVALVQPKYSVPRSIKWLSAVVLLQSVLSAVSSGSKAGFFHLALYALFAYVSVRQRIPWVILIAMLCLYLFVVEPFVTYARHESELANISTVSERQSIFKRVAREGIYVQHKSLSDLNVESLFRGIYPLAGEITRESSSFEGEWKGYTISWGISSLLPRVLNPEKRDMNIGNFFYRTVYARVYMTPTTSDTNNVSISIPFEVVGNYGWISGVLSFALLGIVWSSVVGWFLTPARLSSHPLVPMFISLTLGFEQPIGHWLAALRGLIIPVFILWLVSRRLGGRL
ncbi:MAG: hypothetical protein ABFD64_08875 [Armatimonadota bacterium]